MKHPTISVIMPMRNAEEFVSEAIMSILSQTFTDFELIIVDDCSTDESFRIASRFAARDTRIKLWKNSTHRGVAATANSCIQKSRGMFLARMDADDISLPDRLEKQVEFLRCHPQVVAVGGQFLIINKQSRTIGRRFFPLTHEDIYRQTFTLTALSQPGMMLSTLLLPADFCYYNERLSTAEETELVFRLFHYGRVANLDTVVLKYRMHEHNTSLKNPKKTFFITLAARMNAIKTHRYTPTFGGIVLNILQCWMILLLPRAAIVSLYTAMRNEKDPAGLPAIALGMT